MLSVKKILAGQGAVDYYLNQTRRGLADYYLPEEAAERDEVARLSAPGSSWWGGGAEELALSGEVGRAEFVPLYAKAVRPGGGYLGRRFRLPEEAAAAKADALLAASEISDPHERWLAKHEIRRRAPHASVAAWDCTFSPPKSVSLLWAAGDRHVQEQVWAAHLAAVDAGLVYVQEHAAYVRAGAQGVRVLDTTGLVVARMNECTSRDGDMHLHTHCLVLNRAQTTVDGKWRALDGRALLSARTGAGALYNRTLEAELTRPASGSPGGTGPTASVSSKGWMTSWSRRSLPAAGRSPRPAPNLLPPTVTSTESRRHRRCGRRWRRRPGPRPAGANATSNPARCWNGGKPPPGATAGGSPASPNRSSAERTLPCRSPQMETPWRSCSAGLQPVAGRLSPATTCCVPPSTSSRPSTFPQLSCRHGRRHSPPGRSATGSWWA